MQAVRIDWVGRSKLLIFPLLLLPLAYLLWAGMTNRLGPDPAKALVDQVGLWAFRLLLCSLAMTPMRYMTRRTFWLRYRRMLGLFAFFYATVHLLAYFFLLYGGRLADISLELVRRPYIVIGTVAALLLLPLALTSTRSWQRRLGRRWVDLHQLVYPVAVLVLIHFIWVNKLGLKAVWPYATALALLLGYRLGRRARARFLKI